MISLRILKSTDLPLIKKWLVEDHVKKWFNDPDAWLNEIIDSDNQYYWINHYIVLNDDFAIGFCQYYSCTKSLEPMGGYTKLGGVYSIDYLIGEVSFLHQGFAKKIVSLLENKIKMQKDAKMIVVNPDINNLVSRSLLISCGYEHDTKNDVFIKLCENI